MGGSHEQHVEPQLPERATKPGKTEIGPDAAVEDISEDLPDGDVEVKPTILAVEDAVRLGPQFQGFRIHENEAEGEVHLHETLPGGKSGVKVAMPVAEFWDFWNKISNLRIDAYSFLDSERGTLLTVASGVDEDGKLDLRISLTKEADGVGLVYGEFEKFVEGLREDA